MRKSAWLVFLFVLVGIGVGPSILGAPLEGGIEEASTLERRLLADAADGHLDDFTLLEAGLIASGIPDQRNLNRWTRIYKEREADILETTRGYDSDYERARAIFNRLHRDFLKHYALHASDLISPLNNGRYNCVSATLLYNSLLESAGIPSQAVLVPSHTFSRVTTEKGAIEVETTSPKGFDPVRTEAEYKKLLEQYGLQGTHSSQMNRSTRPWVKEVTGDKKIISSITLVAVIYSNLATARLKDRDTRGATALLVKAGQVAEDPEFVQQSAVALVHNLVVDFIREKQFSQALQMVQEARRVPRLKQWMDKQLDYLEEQCFTHWASHLMDNTKFKKALEVMRRGLQAIPNSYYLQHNRVALYTKWSVHLMNRQEYREACSVLLTGLLELPEETMIQNNYHAAVQHYVKALMLEGNVDKALEVAQFAYAQASKLYRSPKKRVLADLAFQVGWVLFHQKKFLEATKYFEAGTWTNDPLFARNLGASLSNYANAAVQDNNALQAHTVLANTLDKGPEVETDTLWRAYWYATAKASGALVKDGFPRKATKLLTRFSLDKLPATDPALAQHVVSTFARTTSKTVGKSACLSGLAKAPLALQENSWFKDATTACGDNH